MELLYILAFLLGLAQIICFFVMVNDIRTIKDTLKAWQKETGYGISYKCFNCKKNFLNKQEKCPYCGTETNFKER